MANDKDDDNKTPGQNSRPKQSGSERKIFSDETVEQIKGRILFGAGYKRPPKQHQFKKGQSGNPKGRPRSAISPDDRSANALALKHATRMITIREGGEIKQTHAIDAVFLAQYASASKGNAYAQRHTIERYDRAERERRRQIQASNESAEEYVAEAREAIAEAERNGEPAPVLLPHPDDVVIDQDKGVRFVGPIDDKGAKRLEETCRMRDMLIMQDALDRREPDSDDPVNDLLDKPGTALLFALTLNQSVPDRLKISDDLIEIRMLRYERTPKRQLLKDLYKGWRSLGARPKRGQILPPLSFGKKWLALSWGVASAIKSHLDQNAPLADFEAAIAAIVAEWLPSDT